MDTKLNIALVGFGKFGKKYHKNILENKKLILKKIYRKKNYSNKIFEKLSDKSIKINRIQSAIIVTPVKTHYKIAKYFIKKNIPIILEKPAAHTLGEIKKLLVYSQKKKVSVLVNHSDLYNQNFQFLFSKIRLIGKIKYIEANFGKFSQRYKIKSELPSDDWLPHPIAIILIIFKKISNIKVISNKLIKKRGCFFQNMKIKFRINKSLKGQINFSNFNEKKRRNIIIYGEKGLINYDGYSQKNNYLLLNKKISSKKNIITPLQSIIGKLYIVIKAKQFYSDLKLSYDIKKVLNKIKNKS